MKNLVLKTNSKEKSVQKGRNELVLEDSVDKIEEVQEILEGERENQLVELIARILVDRAIAMQGYGKYKM